MDVSDVAGQRVSLPARGRRPINRAVWLLLLIFFTLACRASSPTMEPDALMKTGESQALVSYEDGYFTAAYPDWPVEPESALESEVAVVSRGSGVWIQRFEALPRQVIAGFEAEIANQADAEVLSQTDHGDHQFIEYRSSPDGTPLRHQVLLKYCQGKTDAVAAAGVEASFADRLPFFEEVFAAVECADPISVPALEAGKLAMVVNSAEDDPLTGFYPAYLRTASSLPSPLSRTARIWPKTKYL